MHAKLLLLFATSSLAILWKTSGTIASPVVILAKEARSNIDWTTKIQLENGFEARWLTTDKEWITMEIKGPTSGWVACGFTNNGAMKGADIVMGWVDSDGKANIKDLHGVGNEVPLEDASQDVELLDGTSEDGSTTIRFRRKWNTCDKDDYVIGEQTVWLIWAYGAEDPEGSSWSPKYHGRTDRGVKMVNLRLPPRHSKFPEEMENPDPNIKFFDITMNNYPIPGEEVTQYRCIMFKWPNFEKKSQIVGWRPLLQKENSAIVHHILLMECAVASGNSSAIFEKDLGRVEACYSPNMPPEWLGHCWTQPIVWTIGGEGDFFPSHTGMPMGEKHGGSTYFYMEVHYDNPEKVDFTDSSGLRIYYTEKARPKDLSTLFIGKRFSTWHFIAPGTVGYQVFGGCTSECTRKALPTEGITATHVQLHAHQVTTKIVLRHIRNGVELPPIGMDTNYDINYQQAHIIDPPRKILPGDELFTYCDYDTTDRTVPLWGGITTNDTEMCHSFLTYYPKIKLATCQFQIEYNDFLNAVGVQKLEGDMLSMTSVPFKPRRGDKVDPVDEVFTLLSLDKGINLFSHLTIADPGPNYKKNFWEWLVAKDWKRNNARLANQLNRKLEKSKNYAYCTEEAHARIPLRKYVVDPPKFRPYADPADNYCSRV